MSLSYADFFIWSFASRSAVAALSEPVKHFPPPVLLRVVRIEYLEPCGRGCDIGRELVFGHNSLKVLAADHLIQVLARAKNVLSVQESGASTD